MKSLLLTLLLPVIVFAFIPADYESSGEACGAIYAAPETVFQSMTSPGYPQGYDDGLICEYRFHAPPGRQLELQLEGNVEYGRDFVKIFYGSSDPEIYTGSFSNITLISSRSAAIIYFTSDDAVNMQGFKVRFRQKVTADNRCGGKYIANQRNYQTMSSPGYPSGYDGNLNCEYVFEAEAEHQLEIVLEGQIEEGYDKIEISEDNKIIQNISGVFSNLQFLSKNALVLRFTSDDSISVQGFKVKFREIQRSEISEAFTAPGTQPSEVLEALTTSGLIEDSFPDLLEESNEAAQRVDRSNPQSSCPNTPSSCDKKISWLCEYVRWRIDFMDNWLKEFMNWRDLQGGEKIRLPEVTCRTLNVSCKVANQRSEVQDYFNCIIPYCTDGQYESGPGLQEWMADLLLWQQMHSIWQEALQASFTQDRTASDCVP